MGVWSMYLNLLYRSVYKWGNAKTTLFNIIYHSVLCKLYVPGMNNVKHQIAHSMHLHQLNSVILAEHNVIHTQHLVHSLTFVLVQKA